MKLIIAGILFLVLTSVFSQAQVKKIAVAKGVWTISDFAPGITKIVFKPKGYTSDENITGAVILKPLSCATTAAAKKDDYLLIGKGLQLSIKNVEGANGYNGFQFSLKDGEQIFGGGERALPLNRRGYKFNLYNNPWYGYSEGADNLNFSVPFFTSSEGYGLFFDNASKGYADIGKTQPDTFEAAFSSGEINVYIIRGKNYKEILSSFHVLTGKQPLPPRWAMGNFQSRFGYTSEAQAKEINDKMHAENIPHDAIIFDLFWFGDSIKHTLGNLDWVNTSRWPNPVKMIADFKKKKVHTILITEPFILEGTRQYNAAKKYMAVDSAGKPFMLEDFYFGRGGLLDIFRKDAGDWIWKNHYKKQIANGVNGWWTDLGEPEKHPEPLMHNLKDLGFKRLFKATEVHNAYGHYWNKMLFENYTKAYPTTRLFHLNRSGFAGSQRYSIFPWSGDVSRSWSGLRAQLPLMLGMSMSGIPYIHADAGGFAGGNGDNELYIRWLQFAAFTPVFRPHGTALYEADPNAFSFPSEAALIDEPYRSYAKEIIRQRYSMLPYNYTLAYKHTLKGAPLVAPLYYQFPDDTTACKVNDQFMWGENILVIPVLEKDTNSTTRKYYLPKGDWYATGTNEVTTGAIFKEQHVPINKTISYVKAGSIIVTSGNNTAASTADDNNSTLVVDYYAAAQPSQAEVYEDDGINKQAIVDNKYQLLIIKAMPSPQKLVFNVATKGSGYKGAPAMRKFVFNVHGYTAAGPGLYINGTFKQRIKYPSLDSSGPGNYYSLEIEYNGLPLKIEIK